MHIGGEITRGDFGRRHYGHAIRTFSGRGCERLGRAHQTRGTKTDYPSDVGEEEGPFGAPYLTLLKEAAPQRDLLPARPLAMACATWSVPGARGACAPTICRRGPPSTSRRGAGSGRIVLPRGRTLCAPSCLWHWAGRRIPRRRFTTAAPCRPRRKAERVPPAMGLSGERVPGCISPWTHSGLYWRSK